MPGAIARNPADPVVIAGVRFDPLHFLVGMISPQRPIPRVKAIHPDVPDPGGSLGRLLNVSPDDIRVPFPGPLPDPALYYVITEP